MALASILRPDNAAHQPLPAEREFGQTVAVRARAQQDAIRDRTRDGDRLRCHLSDWFPSFLMAFQHNREGISNSVAHTAPRPLLRPQLTPTTSPTGPRGRAAT